MKKMTGFLISCFILLAGYLSQAQVAAETATEVIRKADQLMRGNTSYARMTIRIERPSWQRELEMRSWSKGNDLAMVRVEAPAKERGIVYLKRKKEVWNWLPSIERNIKLPPSMMSQSWMGTDFTNDDLVKEFSIIEDYTHEFTGEETIDGRSCHRITLIPKPGAAVVWGKLLVWIDKKDYLQLKAEYYDETGILVNLLKGSEIRILGGRLLPTRMDMYPVAKKGNRTVMLYREVLFDKPIGDDFFTVENMKRLK